MANDKNPRSTDDLEIQPLSDAALEGAAGGSEEATWACCSVWSCSTNRPPELEPSA